MTLTVTHAFTSAIADDPAAASAGAVLPSHWNADHALVGTALDHFAESIQSVPAQVAALAAQGADDDIAAALVAKGSGAVQAQIADATAAGGNARGQHAVDWQSQRAFAAQVAGDYAAIGGGEDNRADGSHSWIGGGKAATTRGVVGAHAHGAGMFAAYGDAQFMRYVMRAQTTDATAARMSTDGGAVSGSNQVALPEHATFTVSGRVSARQPATGDSKGWTFDAVIRRGASSAVTLGETTAFGSVTHDEGFIVAARKITVPAGGAVLQSLAALIGTASGNGRLALYDASNGGKPGALIAQTASVALIVGENTWAVTPTAVPAGDYWIAYQFDDPNYRSTQHTGGPSGDSWYVVSGYVPFPATFDANPLGDTVYYAVSANFTTAGVALVAAVTPTAIAADAGASAWALAVDADNANGVLAATVTGEAAKTIQWVAVVDTTQNVG